MTGGGVSLLLLLVLFWWIATSDDREENGRFSRGETELEVANPGDASIALLIAGDSYGQVRELSASLSDRQWLPPGRYMLRAAAGACTLWYPVPLTGYRSGPDEEGTFRVTVRSCPDILPPTLPESPAPFVHLPAGSFLFGGRLNPREQHHVWLPAFFLARFELTNGEFRRFTEDPEGYENDGNWTERGRRWREGGVSRATAALRPSDPAFMRFGRDDQPVLWVNWFEAMAYCSWLTRTIGEGRWLYQLPTEAEWEKSARGPESFDFMLGMQVSDAEADLYNWRKNPGADTTVVGSSATPGRYPSNTYGIYHLTGNALEWTRSQYVPFNRHNPYRDDARNDPEGDGHRVARGGSWYSASNAYLNVSYRDAFQPEHSSQELGFRIVARRLP